MTIEEITAKIESEKKRAVTEDHSTEGLIRLQEVASQYDGEYKLIWSEDIIESLKNRPRKPVHKTKLPLLDDIIGGFREQQLVTLSASTKHGKCLAKGTGVMMFDGSSKKVEEIVVGDEVMGPDSKPRKVLALGRGNEEMFRIKQRGGEYVVNGSHILSLKRTGTSGNIPKGTLVNISVNEYLEKSKSFKHTHKGWFSSVDFPHQDVDLIDPYYLGVWLGDGTSTSSAVTNIEPEIEDFLYDYAEEIHMKYTKKADGNKAPTLSITQHYRNSYGDSLHGRLRDANLLSNKHIPTQYLRNSTKVRLQVLAGLIDTDGSLSNNKWPWYEIIQKSDQLAADIVYLARSLGYGVTLHKSTKGIKSLGFEGEYNRIRISGDLSKIPTKVKRKQTEYACTKDVTTSRIDIEPLGIGEYYGFELDGDGLFLLDNFIVTHNTSMGMFLTEQMEDLNPVVIPLEQSNEELIDQRLENGYSVPKFLSPAKLAARVTTDWIEQRVIEGIAKYNTKFILIDHLGYIDSFGDKRLARENLAYRTGEIMRSLKNIAKRWNVIIVLLVHISQKDEGHPPTLEDIKNSSDIAQESDMIIMLWRKNSLHKKVRVYEEKTLVSVMANRRTGKNGNVGLRFNTKTGRYEEDNTWVSDMEKMAKLEIEADEKF